MISRTNACFDFSTFATSDIHDARVIHHHSLRVTTGLFPDFRTIFPFSILGINDEVISWIKRIVSDEIFSKQVSHPALYEQIFIFGLFILYTTRAI